MPLTTDLKRLLQHLSRRRLWQLAGLTMLMLTGAAAEMATLGAVVPFLGLLSNPSAIDQYPLITSVLNALGFDLSNMLLAAGVLFGVVALLAAALRMLLMWVLYRFTFGLGADLGGEVYLRTLHQPYAWHVRHNTSEILAGIQKVNAVIYSVMIQLMQGGVSLLITLAILAALLVIDFQTAMLAGIGFSALYGATTLITRRKVLRNSATISRNETLRMQSVQEGLGGIRDVLLDSSQPIYHRRFALQDYAMRRAQASNSFIAASPRFVIESAGMILIVALAFWLSGREGGLTSAIPVLGALAIGAQKLLPQMQQAYAAWSSINGSRDQLHDVLALLERPDTQASRHSTTAQPTEQSATQFAKVSPLIAFSKVSFQYRKNAAMILDGTSFSIARGARVGIVGQTGSGKSTLVDLIMGLITPSAGQILIDGKPLTEENRRHWQARIAHVPQAIFLSDATIAENIAFGVVAERIDLERMRLAASRAQLSDFVEHLPAGYQTPVGERGVRLSGGQRQRIGLARALYKRADVLVLDEATSALDDATEQAVMNALAELGNEITVLMIAHRVSTLSRCDAILIVDAGQTPRWVTYPELVSSRVGQSTFNKPAAESVQI